jgi:hypothetical protein
MTFEPVRNDDGELIGFNFAEPAPRFRYFQTGRGPMFSWTTETCEGKYVSFVHVPVGKGARSGKAEEWRLVDESISAHDLRKDAKARALRLFRAWQDGELRPWA